MTGTIESAAETTVNPYVGPRSLRAGERIDGRSRELDQLCDAVVADRVVLLYSPSGAGKSSLLEAGLRPSLQAKGFDVAPTIRVNQDVPGNRYAVSAMLSLDEANVVDERTRHGAFSETTLARYVADSVTARHPESETCLVFDQFEEVFTLDPVDVDVKADFFGQLGELLHDRGVWAVIAMREDYIAHLDPFLKVFPRRLSTRLRLDFLDERSAIAAVQNPSAAIGVEFTGAAAERLVRDLRTVMVTKAGIATAELGRYVEPVQLQVVCSQLWSRLPADTTSITPDDVERFADTDNALAHFYGFQVAATAAATGQSERTIRDWFEQRLITPHGFRAQTFEFPGDRGLAVLAALEDAYLVRAETRRGVKWYELTHDRMIDPVRENNAEWRDAQLSPLQKRAAEWNANQRPTGLLVGGDVLAEAEAWISGSSDASDVERDFVAASRSMEDEASAELHRHITETRRAKRRSMIFAGLAVAALVGLITATVATFEARQRTAEARDARRAAELSADEADESRAAALRASDAAETSKSEAEARDLAARSSVAVSPYDAALLALEAEFWTDDPLPQGRVAWRDAVARLARQPVVRTGTAIETGAGYTWDVAWSPDGRHLATANEDGTMRVFDAATRAPLGDGVETGEGSAWSVAWSPDGTRLATGNEDGTVRVFDAATLAPIGEPVDTGDSTVWTVAWRPDGNQMAAGIGDGSVWIFDAGSLDRLDERVSVGASNVLAVAWNPAGTVLATGSADRTMQLFDATTLDPIGDPIVTGDGFTNWVAWSPAGTVLAAGNDDGTMQLFDATTLDPIGEPVETGEGSTRSVAWKPDGSVMATGNDDGAMRLFDATTLDPIGDPVVPGDGPTYSVAWTVDGSMLATGNDDGVRLFEPAAAGQQIDVGNGSTWAVAWNPTGAVLATASGDGDGRMRLFDAGTFAPIGDPVETGDSFTFGLAWSPDGSVLASANESGTLQLLDAATFDAIGEPVEIGQSFVHAVAWSPDGTTLATGDGGGTIRLFDGNSLRPLNEKVDARVGSIWTVQWSPDGAVLAVGGLDGTRLYDAVTLDQIGDPLDTGGRATWSIGWHPQGSVLAVGNDDGTIRLFDPQTRDLIAAPIDAGSNFTFAVAWNPDGTVLATGNGDGTMRLFDGVTLEPIGEPLNTGEDRTFVVAWHPDGTLLATGNGDGTMRVFSSWTESAACSYLASVMGADEMDDVVGIEGAASRCADGELGVLPAVPVAGRPLP